MAEFEVIRGAENEIEFQGLRGKYVYTLLIGLACSILLGLVLFVLLPSPTMAGILTLFSAVAVGYYCIRNNKRYGRWGMEKATIHSKLPEFVIISKPRSHIRKKKK